jgi:hypothetical protein
MNLHYATVISENPSGSYQVRLDFSQQQLTTDSLVTTRLVHGTPVTGYRPGDQVMVAVFGHTSPGRRSCIIGLVAQTTPSAGAGTIALNGTAHATHTP